MFCMAQPSSDICQANICPCNIWPGFHPKELLTKYIFGWEHFLMVQIFPETKFFWHNIFCTNNLLTEFFDPKCFGQKLFLDHQFLPKLFNQHVFGPTFSGSKILCEQIFAGAVCGQYVDFLSVSLWDNFLASDWWKIAHFFRVIIVQFALILLVENGHIRRIRINVLKLYGINLLCPAGDTYTVQKNPRTSNG